VIKNIEIDIPEFVHRDISLREITMIAYSQPNDYFSRRDEIFWINAFVSNVTDIFTYIDGYLPTLVDEDYDQIAEKLVIAATQCWATQVNEAVEGFGEGDVFLAEKPPMKPLSFSFH